MQWNSIFRSWIVRALLTRNGMLLGMFVLMGAFGASSAHAQGAATKVGVANPSRIFSDIQETKDFVSKMKGEMDTFKTEQNTRTQKLKDMQTQRDMFKPESPQFQEADNKLLEMSVEFEIYVRTYQLQLERKRKDQIIKFFKKITAAVSTVAKQKSLDLVVADVEPDLPTDPAQLDQINENTLKGLLAQRNVLYSAESIDISAAVILLLDKDYREGK